MDFGLFLQDKLGVHSPEEIEELTLSELFKIDSNSLSLNSNQKAALEKYRNLTYLNMNNLGLSSFDNFPRLNKLQVVCNYIYTYI